MPITTVVLAYIARRGRVLLTRRPAGAHLAGAWEFPGGKVEPGETPRAALAREVAEELGVTVRVEEELAAVTHAYPDRTVALRLYRCALEQGEPTPRQADALRWAPEDAFDAGEMPPANAALLAALRGD
ncbi:MAG TPA: 8-oxo-dGTP diphosphatase MutT [Armatimonadota bacterium]|nr:8-oxo-dGTP diphosphatase MutT [Armatimonadota bacterium]